MLRTLRRRVAFKNCNYGLLVTPSYFQLSPLLVKSCAGHNSLTSGDILIIVSKDAMNINKVCHNMLGQL